MIGIAMTIIAALSILDLAFTEIGNWELWIILIGIGIAFIGSFWLMTYVKNVRKFRKYMLEQSMANFRKELSNIEYLTLNLPSKYEKELKIKKKRFGLK